MKRILTFALILVGVIASADTGATGKGCATLNATNITTIYRGIQVPMRDGLTLTTDVYLPDSKGSFPCILIRSPYNGCSGLSDYCLDFVARGFGFIQQDCRGTGTSAGEADLWRQEKEDSQDFLKWLTVQPWFNGRLVTNGESYPGHCQWQIARTGDQCIKGITPHNAPLDIYGVVNYRGGALTLGCPQNWGFGMRAVRTKVKADTEKSRRHLPLLTADEVAGLGVWPMWREWMTHSARDSYWESSNIHVDIAKISAPAYITAGWYDAFLKDSLQAFSEMRDHAKTGKARKWTRLCVEPFDHDMRVHDVDYGDNYKAGIIEIRRRFMEGLMTDPEKDPIPDQPAVKLFVMGANRWIESDSWPLPSTEYRPIYLDGDGHANSILGDGRLSFAPPSGGASHDSFIYNPLLPVPSAGGNSLGGSGQRSQEEIEKRSDVLVYTSEPLTNDLNVIGNVTATLYASSSAPDTDFTVKLCDVWADGRSFNVCDGLFRARYLNRPDKPEQIESGNVYEFKIDMWATATTFLKGHRIRIQVSSSNFPRFDRNLNTGDFSPEATEMRTAFQKVMHNTDFRSCVTLPVVDIK